MRHTIACVASQVRACAHLLLLFHSYNGYRLEGHTQGGPGKRAYPWWEAVSLFRRTAVSAIASTIHSAVLQAVASQGLFLALLLAHIKCVPYSSKELNLIDMVMLLALLVTQFGCVVVATMQNWNMNLPLAQQERTGDLIGWSLVALNAAVLAWVAYRLLLQFQDTAMHAFLACAATARTYAGNTVRRGRRLWLQFKYAWLQPFASSDDSDDNSAAVYHELIDPSLDR